MTPTTLVSSEVSLPFQGYTQNISVLSRELKSQSLSTRHYGDSTGLVTEELPKTAFPVLSTATTQQLNSKLPVTEKGGERVDQNKIKEKVSY